MVTGLGDNYISGFILKFLQSEGIDTQYIATKPGAQTNSVLVALQPPEGMQFVANHASNADLDLTIDDINHIPLEQTRALLVSGMALLRDPSRSATQTAVERGRASGALVVMDLDFRAPMWADARVYGVTTRLTLPLVDVAAGTEEEVMAAAGEPEIESAIDTLRGRVRQALVVKQGARGATVYPVDGEPQHAPAFDVPVVNFLGAGDAFAGGLIAARLQGDEWPAALRFANACGAILVSDHGTGSAMPTRQDVETFMASVTAASKNVKK
jgi:5-dehydro-2-deoxygluconokinase